MGKTDPETPIVIRGAGPIIHLDELDCLDLLADFCQVLVPEAVWQEVERHRPTACHHRAATLQRVSPETPAPPELEAVAQLLNLHAGEWEALRVPMEHPQALLLTDDTAARLAASSLGIRPHGTIGLLVRAIRRQQRSKAEVLAILRSMPAHSTLHLKRSLLDAVIAEVELGA
ncbi:MAG: DNA-binding protein [Verrucomicrobiales bacterium]